MTSYQGWVLAALILFSVGPAGISLWLSSSYLAVLPRKRARLLAGAATLAGLLLSGWVPGIGLLSRLSDSPGTRITTSDVVVLAYLHATGAAGLGILIRGRRRAPRPIPSSRDEDLGLGERLLALHRSRSPRSFLLRVPRNQAYGVRLRDWLVPVRPDGRPLPPALEGFTILHLSDLHLGSYLVPEYFEALREQVRELPHDVLVFTGDFLHRGGRPEELAAWLEGFQPGKEAFAVLGNHDLLDHDVPRLAAALRGAGVRLLDREVALVRKGTETIGFAGLDYQNWWRPFALAGLRSRIPDGALPVLITHTPCPFPQAAREGFRLVLCGHTHGGQIRLPGVGAVFIPARYGRRYQMGLYREGESFLHVHPGLGGPPALRLGCPPEITRLILTA